MASKLCFSFGPYSCSWSEAFVQTRLSIAMVNLKPLVPGHVLVIPRRVVPKFEDLTGDEVADLWSTAHQIAPILRRHFRGDALTFAIQDGPAAGQTVPHTHIHILPRRAGDFQRNDEVYEKLEELNLSRGTGPLETRKNGLDLDVDRKPRTREEMTAESMQLRPLFKSISLAFEDGR